MAQFNEDFAFAGQVIIMGAFYPPAGFLSNSHVAANAAIAASKLIVNRSITEELFGPAVTITALTKTIYAAKGPGTINAFRAWIETQATDVSRTVNVDLQKSTAGGAWTTVLSATVAITSSTTVRTRVAGVVSSAAYVAGDLFRAVVTVAGGSGSQALGLGCQLDTDESYA